MNTELSKTELKSMLREAAHDVLDDIEFRVKQAYDVERRGSMGKVYAEDLALLGHMITGYTITANSPGAGQVAWASLHVVYNGTDYAITNGNTANTYIWFDAAISTTVLQTGNTRPTLTGNACLLWVNNSGTPAAALVNGGIAAAIGNLSVDSGALQPNSVIAGKIATGAINGSGLFTAGVVNNAALGSAAVAAPNLSILQHVIY